MTAFNMERLHNCAFNLGMASAAYDEAVAYTSRRQAFGSELIDFQSVYHGLVDMWTDMEALRLMAQPPPRRPSTAIPPVPGDVDGQVVRSPAGGRHHAARPRDARRLRRDQDYVIERIHRDVVATIVAGGSPPVLRNTIAGELFAPRRFPQRRSA